MQVFVGSESLDKNGLVFDFVKLKKYLKGILKKLDHKLLNEIAYFKKNNPSSENIARYIYLNMSIYFAKNKSINLEKVCVWETPTSYACYQEL